jgi:hypothetical protein
MSHILLQELRQWNLVLFTTLPAERVPKNIRRGIMSTSNRIMSNTTSSPNIKSLNKCNMCKSRSMIKVNFNSRKEMLLNSMFLVPPTLKNSN